MSTRPRNDDLPILTELGDDLGAGFRRAERAESARRNRRRLRRVAAATAALFVIVPGAVATRYIWAPDPTLPAKSALESSRAIQIADGRGEVLRWRLSAAVTETEGVCWQIHGFTDAENYGRTPSCDAEPFGQPLGVATLGAAGETLIFGWLEPRVARVTVDPGNGAAPKEAEIVIASADRIEQAGLPEGARAYVTSFLGDLSESGPPTARAFDASGREIGRMPPSR